jgi:Uma2 family endonuclease
MRWADGRRLGFESQFVMLLTMPVAVAKPRRKAARFSNGAEWWHAIGDVPLHRVVFDPLPGTAAESDLLRLLEHDDRPCELIDGTLVEKPVGTWESFIAARIIIILGTFASTNKLGVCIGEQGPSRTSPSRIRIPDVSFFSADQFPGRKIPRVPVMPFSPALAIEVLSKSNTKRVMQQKLKEYFAAETREVWIVDPKQLSIAVYERGDGKPVHVFTGNETLAGRKLLPGFRMKLAAIFSEEL